MYLFQRLVILIFQAGMFLNAFLLYYYLEDSRLTDDFFALVFGGLYFLVIFLGSTWFARLCVMRHMASLYASNLRKNFGDSMTDDEFFQSMEKDLIDSGKGL